jgi:hypothetical protein|tara:strand:+ start:43 stop:363 length:321 start_codon:yes stop_codon:yes gene_type:complete
MTKWIGILHRDLRPRKPSTKPLVQKAIARNLVRDYGLSPKQAQKFSRGRRKITIKRPAIQIPYDRKGGVKTISGIEKLRQRLRQRFRPVQLAPRVPMFKGRVRRVR